MAWLCNLIIDILTILVYMCVVFPLYIVLHLFFMFLVVLALPLKIPAINKMAMRFLKQKK